RALGIAHHLIDGQTVDARHGCNGRALVMTVGDEHGPDQVVCGEYVFAHHAPRPFGLAVAARADGQVEGRGRRGGLTPWHVARFDRTPEFDRHGIASL